MLEFHQVNVLYGRIRALHGVSLKVAENSIHAVLGANGAGKSTLLRCAIGLSGPHADVRLNGTSLAGMPTHKRVALGIAMVHEGRRLFPEFSVEENLRAGAYLRTDVEDVEQDIDRLCTVFPILRQRFAQRASTLSGGEAQMLAISRALMARPRVLLLDEPSVGIMPRTVSEIFAMLREIPRQNVTVLLVEQNASKALTIADEVTVLEQGRVVATGSAAQMSDDARVREAYLGG